ncbi:MAG: hypothetical protein L6R40_008105 [Gallowayella cf. fulva]|nr:MAG: hypothetical protein L6R40_008105 [Xanthomendoza cf. fulva]
MSTTDLHGILVALITPFTDDGSAIDETRLHTHIEHMIQSGVHGLVPGGTTGEFTALTLPERNHLTDLCITSAAGRVPVIPGIGALSTRDCLSLATHAASAGAAALMLVPPFYDPVSLPQLRALCFEIHSSVSLPLLYYHIPSASGLHLTPVELAGLSDVGVRYLKDTSGDAPAFTELLHAYPEQITAFNGWDTLTFYGLAAGAKGSVWGTTNLLPELSVRLWDALKQGDLVEARKLWKKIWPVCRFLEAHHYTGAVKTGMELLGQGTGGVRKPFGLLVGEEREELRGLLEGAGLRTVR